MKILSGSAFLLALGLGIVSGSIARAQEDLSESAGNLPRLSRLAPKRQLGDEALDKAPGASKSATAEAPKHQNPFWAHEQLGPTFEPSFAPSPPRIGTETPTSLTDTMRVSNVTAGVSYPLSSSLSLAPSLTSSNADEEVTRHRASLSGAHATSSSLSSVAVAGALQFNL